MTLIPLDTLSVSSSALDSVSIINILTAFFCNPNFDKFIDAIPGTYEAEGKKYEGINSGQYLVQRLTATY